MWIGLLGLRLDRSGVQSGDPGAQCVQVWHRSRSCVRRGSKWWKAHRRSPLEGSRLHVRFDEPSGRAPGCDASDLRPMSQTFPCAVARSSASVNRQAISDSERLCANSCVVPISLDGFSLQNVQFG
jgi:hypothetical protein